MNFSRISLPLLTLSFLLPACHPSKASEDEVHHEEAHKIVVTNPVVQDVVSTRQYVSQIHSRRHIEVRALESGYLGEVHIREGQAVKKGDVLFRITPVLYQANLDSEEADAQLARIKYENTKLLSDQDIVSQQELALSQAELARAQAQVSRARAELNFTGLVAPFDGIVDRQLQQQGSLVSEGDILSTLSDNSVMWVYFNVPEISYFEYKARLDDENDGLAIELKLANGEIFAQKGEIGAIEADFNNETGNIPFRADFPNPDGLLRHGQTGTILIHRTLHDAIVIPQRATYEILAKKYVYVVEPLRDDGARDQKQQASAEGHVSSSKKPAQESTGEAHVSTAKHGNERSAKSLKYHGVVRQREIVIQEELDDIYVIKKGLNESDKIVFEGTRQVRDGDEVEYELRPPKVILANQKSHAE